ncbi:hypothetical protein Mal4_24600 [Maioricimonas rarisocia]|uniref:Uncharacterized protein n=1 Tax=Maioricimonas rarisocia TaxID=2528026 RepID=A0A517Z6M6_9PLAN|nr:hypothetical protein Mal4_24600 [Maioricimonas rarisocia]
MLLNVQNPAERSACREGRGAGKDITHDSVPEAEFLVLQREQPPAWSGRREARDTRSETQQGHFAAAR